MEKIFNKYTDSSESISEQILPVIESDPDDEVSEDREWVYCRSCGLKITRTDQKIRINDAGHHIFMNPAGIFFRVLCFSSAPGLANITGYTGENTWFPGYSWSVSICRRCNIHIGWHYSSGSAGFYGLIADRLAGV